MCTHEEREKYRNHQVKRIKMRKKNRSSNTQFQEQTSNDDDDDSNNKKKQTAKFAREKNC